MFKHFIIAFSFVLLSSTLSAHDDLPSSDEHNWGGSIFGQFGYYHDEREQGSWSIPGFMTSAESAPHEAGLQLFHGEVQLYAQLPKLLKGKIIIGSHGSETVDIEELWLSPYLGSDNWQIKLGRQLTDIGLYNQTHDHEWLFIDANLPQQAFLGGQYSDDSVQLSWLPAFHKLSIWAARGSNFPASKDTDSGDISAYGVSWSWTYSGEQHSLLVKSSIAHFNATERGKENSSEHSHNGAISPIFTGDSNLISAGFQWQWLAFGWDFEAIAQQATGEVKDSLGLQADLDVETYGLNNQLYYQWSDWQFALRYDWLNSSNQLSATSNEFKQTFDSQGHNPNRISAIANWYFLDKQLLRLQANHEQLTAQSENVFWLVYQGTLAW